ncbi:hypothetical protein PFTANZ_03978 [Plasmodium falciparum Tanzania (2000708)]|uniref:Ubiquitin-like protease family profile domain-containing protein n=2 Tax=Plasmodium falciparum TaxID=5833 RepID=A0A024W3S4_PLAFA|nr:hypothetical protein PFTANZ_03978 [Plasmodium falciparum Tanzania (2000708)]ETW41512.1 hypothetical protein PFNF135_04159 [Plasmodium falciparum NF135/5.C10]
MNFYKLKKKGEEDYDKYISNKEKKKKVDKNFLYEDEYIHIRKSRDRKSEVSINDEEYVLKKKKNSNIYESKRDNSVMGMNNINNKIYKDKMNKHISNHKKNHNKNIHKNNHEESNSGGFIWNYMKNIYSSVTSAVKNNIFTNDKHNNMNDISSLKKKHISNNSRLIDKNLKKNKNNRDSHFNEYKYDYVKEKFKDNISAYDKRHEQNYKKIYQHDEYRDQDEYQDEYHDEYQDEYQDGYQDEEKKKEIDKYKKKKGNNTYYDFSENDFKFLFKSDNEDFNDNNINYENNLSRMNIVRKDDKIKNTLYNDIAHHTDEYIYMDIKKKKKSQLINKNIHQDNIIEHDKSKQKNGLLEDTIFNHKKSHSNLQRGVRQKEYHDNKNIFDGDNNKNNNDNKNNNNNNNNNNNGRHSLFNKKGRHSSNNLYNINDNKNDFFLHSSDEERDKKYKINLEVKKEKTKNHVILSNENYDGKQDMDNMKPSKSSVRNINTIQNDHNKEDEIMFKTHTQNHNSTEKLYYEHIFEEINKHTNDTQHFKENTSNAVTNVIKDTNEKINNIDNHITNKNSDIQNEKDSYVEYDMSSNKCDQNDLLNITTPITDHDTNDLHNINSNNYSTNLNKEEVFNEEAIKDNDILKKLRYEYKNLINIIDSFIDETLNYDLDKNSPVSKLHLDEKNDKMCNESKDHFLNNKNNFKDNDADEVYNNIDDDYKNSMKFIEDTSSEDKNKYVILKYDEDSLIEALEKLRIDKKKKDKLIKLKEKYPEDIEKDAYDDETKKKKIDKNIFFKCSKKEYYEKAIIILNEKIENRVLIEKFNVPLLYSQIKCLIDTRWLNDEVINFYLSMLQEYNEQHTKNNSLTFIPKIFTFSTFFFQSLNFNGSYNYSKVSRWTKRKQVDIFSFDLILIPLHVGGNHWTLGSIHMKDKKICLYDSLNGSNKKFFEYMRRYIVDEMKDKKQKDLDISLWTYSKEGVSEKGIPHQENGYDCGVFTCMFAKCLSFNREFDFNQRDIKDIRLKMTYEISQGCLVF